MNSRPPLASRLRGQGSRPAAGGAWLAFWLLLSLGGCAGSGSVPEDHYYRLATLPVVEPFDRAPLEGVVRVERIDAMGLLRDRAMLFSRADTPQRLQRHHYHHWVDPPPRLVRDQLVRYLRDRNLAGLVATEPMARAADLRLHLVLHDFSRRLHAPDRHTVRVELELVVQTAGDDRPLLLRHYAREVAAANGSPAAAVLAFDQALAEIYGVLVQDLVAPEGR